MTISTINYIYKLLEDNKEYYRELHETALRRANENPGDQARRDELDAAQELHVIAINEFLDFELFDFASQTANDLPEETVCSITGMLASAVARARDAYDCAETLEDRCDLDYLLQDALSAQKAFGEFIKSRKENK